MIYDIGIVGAGPAGYTAALHAAKKGLSVVLFEKDCIGGVCLNRGCIPTKAILHSAEVFDEFKCAESLGINVSDISLDFQKVMERKNVIVSKLRKSLELMIKNSKITVINAEASIKYKNTVTANGETYTCRKIICAAGSEPGTFKGLEFDHYRVLSSDDVLNLQELPKSIVIVGSGAIGVEWARIFASFGVDVTVVEAAESLLPAADIDVSKRLERIFKTRKISFYKGKSVDKIERGDICKIHLSSGEILEAETVLVAVGRKVDFKERINGVEYIGDVCGEIQLAHYAIKQAAAVVDGIPFDKNFVPSVIYGNPEIAWFGKREQDLEEGSYQKANLLISALGKSQCDNAVDGFIKILSQGGQIAGAHIVSKEASSLIQQLIIAAQNKISVDKLKEVCFAHPTYSEGIFEALFTIL